MRKLPGRVKALCAFFVVAVALAACGSDVPGNSVADVAGNPITTKAFNHWMYVLVKSQAAQDPGSPVIIPDPPQFNHCVAQVKAEVPGYSTVPAKQIRTACQKDYTTLSGHVMQFLIESYWYQLEGNREHIKVTNAAVNQSFAAAKAQRFPAAGQFQAFLTQTGQTLADILFSFRINVVATKLAAKETKQVTSSEIQQYYNSHRSQFGTPETRDIRIVVTKTLSQANAAKNALSSGQSWNKVALKYSVDPTTRTSGGLLLGQTKGEQDPALDNPAFAAPVNKLLGPVKGQFGYYVFEVVKITASTQQSLAQATPVIRQTLQGQQSTTSANAVVKLMRKHWLAQTSCRSGYVTTSYCPGYKAPKTTTTSGSGG